MLTLLLVILFGAAALDLYKGKISNYLIVAGILAGLVRLWYLEGIREIFLHIPGMMLPVLLLFPLYRIGTVGAGDLKLFSLISCYFSCIETVYCIFVSFLIGAVFSVFLLLWRKNFASRMAHLLFYLKQCISTGHIQFYYLDSQGRELSQEIQQSSKLHFAIPIFFSVLLHIGGVF